MADMVRGGIIINEILAQPVGGSGQDTDGNGTVQALDEFIELRNASSSAVDISGLQLWDPGNGNWFTFPAGSVLAPGGHAIVMTGLGAGGSLPAVPAGSLAFSAGRNSPLINNPGDNLYVVDPAANSYIAVAYGDWPLLDPHNLPPVPPGPVNGLAGFPPGAVRIGAGEHLGPVVAGQSVQRGPGGGAVYNNLGSTPGQTNLCFTGGTIIATAYGPTPIERLRIGDFLATHDGGLARLVWAGARRVRVADVGPDPAHWPVAIEAGAFGAGRPARRLVLSPQHRVLVRGALARKLAGTEEALVAAQALCGQPGIRRQRPMADFSYHHLLCDRHVVLLAEGLAAESLYLGPVARDALPDAARDEVLGLFPSLRRGDAPEPARPFLRTGAVRRHLAAGGGIKG